MHSRDLASALSLSLDVVERHLQYCADYDLVTWRKKDAAGLAMITDRGRDYLIRQSL